MMKLLTISETPTSLVLYFVPELLGDNLVFAIRIILDDWFYPLYICLIQKSILAYRIIQGLIEEIYKYFQPAV